MFNKTKIPTVAALGAETQSVLSVFRQAISNLSDINKRAEVEREQKLAEAKQAQEDAASLKTLCEDNTAVVNNINKLLNKNQDVQQKN